jgi:hypothetical protein
MGILSEDHQGRFQTSIRINEKVAEVCKDTGLHMNNIVENALVHFCRLNDEEKIKLLVENNPDKIETSELLVPNFNFADRALEAAQQKLGKSINSIRSTKILIMLGLSIVLLLLLGKKK